MAVQAEACPTAGRFTVSRAPPIANSMAGCGRKTREKNGPYLRTSRRAGNRQKSQKSAKSSVCAAAAANRSQKIEIRASRGRIGTLLNGLKPQFSAVLNALKRLQRVDLLKVLVPADLARNRPIWPYTLDTARRLRETLKGQLEG
jgi:hypothetical protein